MWDKRCHYITPIHTPFIDPNSPPHTRPKIKRHLFFLLVAAFWQYFYTLYNAHKFCTRIVYVCVCLCQSERFCLISFRFFSYFLYWVSSYACSIGLTDLLQNRMHIANAMWFSLTFYLTSSWQFFFWELHFLLSSTVRFYRNLNIMLCMNEKTEDAYRARIHHDFSYHHQSNINLVYSNLRLRWIKPWNWSLSVTITCAAYF